MINRADADGQANAERPPSPQTPHPRAPDPPPRGIKFPISFRLINAAGDSTFVKFHWRPKLGLQSTVWDEAVKIAGADQDFHRRDMFEAIEAGDFPEWDLAVQLFIEEQADGFPFDHLDATKLIPEELVPLKVIGRMVLDRWPNNFFAETEHVDREKLVRTLA